MHFKSENNPFRHLANLCLQPPKNYVTWCFGKHLQGQCGRNLL